MANFISRFLGLAGVYGDEYEDDEFVDGDNEYEGESESNVLNASLRRGQNQGNHNLYGGRNNGNVINLRTQNNFTNSVVITKPEGLEDAQQITDYLKERRTVFLNLEDADPVLARRIVDFLSGSVYALEADFQKASKGVFIVAPSNVEVQPLKNDLKASRGYFPFANGSYR